MAMVINEADSSIYSSNASPIRIHLSYASVGNRIALARGEVIKEVILWTHFILNAKKICLIPNAPIWDAFQSPQ